MNPLDTLPRCAQLRLPTDVDWLLTSLGKRTEPGGNEPVQLCRENGGWFIARGKVEVFAAGRQEARPLARQHLATFAATEVLLSASSPVDPRPPRELVEGEGADGPYELVGFAQAGTQLVQFDASEFDRLARDPSSAGVVEGAVALWARKLRGAVSHGRIGPGDAPLEGLSPTALLEAGRFWEEIRCVHSIVLRHVTNQLPARIRSGRMRLQRRMEVDAEILREAQSQLAAVLGADDNPALAEGYLRQVARARSQIRPYVRTSKSEPQRTAVREAEPAAPTGADPLADACRRITDRLGVNLRTPPDAADALTIFQRVQRLCDASRLHSRKVVLRDHWWRHDNGPLLAFLRAESRGDGTGRSENELRPVALLPSSATSYQLVDPQAHTAVAIDATIARSLADEAFVLYPTRLESLARPGDLLGPALHRHWRGLLAIAAMALGGGLLGMLVPIVTGIVYGRIIPGGYLPELAQLALGLVAAGVGACAFQITRALSVLRLTSQLDLQLQPDVWGRLLALPASFFRRFTVGDLADRIQGVGIIRQILVADVTTTTLALVVSATSFALLFYYSWPLALVAVGLLAGLASATVVLSRIQLRHRRRSCEVRGDISSLAFALIQGISKLRTDGAEVRSYGVWAARFAEESRHALQARRIATLQVSLNACYLVAVEMALFALMGLGLRNSLPLSSFLAFSAAFGQVQAAVLTFISLMPELLAILPIYERLRPVLEEAPEIDESKAAVELSGAIKVSHASFRYQEDGPLVLDDVSLEAHPGEFIAIVGPSGSGKSTLVRLLLGFDRPNSGSIRYDDRDLASLDVKSVRRQIGAVLQNSKPLTGDIFTTIVGGTSNNADAAWEAARIAGIDEEIRAMPMGMHTLIGEGATTFSGGERQRLMIARAVVNRPRIVLLDEATSALDNRLQNKVQQCIEQLNATRIVVAHRLSTIRNAARIYVLDRGRVVEEGTYDHLLNGRGYFAEMVRRQLY